MKYENIKTIIVECKFKDSTKTVEFDIDSEIFDDVYLEAGTRFVENLAKKSGQKITPILTTFERKDIKNYKKHFAYNSYFLLINAGQYRKAEVVRQNFIKMTNVDLKLESIKNDNSDV